MGHARLKSLTLKGFRSFAGESTVTFPETGMILFRGHNLDTGGSSGSGKSSLLLAISYLFGFCRFPATSLQSWLTEEPLEVTGVLQVDDGELVISRGSKLSLTLNGKKIAGSAKQLEEQITQLVGLGPELLAALTYRGQKQPGLFLSKTDAEKKEFLTVLLDLSKFEAAVEASQVAVKKREESVAGIKFILERLKAERDSYKNIPAPVLQSEDALKADLARAQAAQERVFEQIQKVRERIKQHQETIEGGAFAIKHRAQPTIERIERELATVKAAPVDMSSIDRSKLAKLNADLVQADAFFKEEQTRDQARWRVQRNEADSVYAQLMLLEKRLAQKPVLEKRLIQLQGEISKLEASLCPTCERQWDEAQTRMQELIAERVKAAQDRLELDGLGPQISSLQERFKVLGQFEPSPVVEELRLIVGDLSREIAVEEQSIQSQESRLRLEHQELISGFERRLATIKANVAMEIEMHRAHGRDSMDTHQEEMEVLERDQRMAASQIQGIQAALSRVQVDNAREASRIELAQRRLADAEVRVTNAEKDLEAEQVLLNAELDFQKLIGREGFLGAIFDEVLWEISEETNRLLGQFPNTSHVTLYFRSEASTQKGTIKKSITPVVTIGGFEAPLAAGLSGGMETAVELAVDLAVATVVSRRTGAVPGWLILDESFTGLGPVEAEASMEILRAFSEDKLVMVVDHASEFKSLFSQFVDVKYQGGMSRVESE